MTRLAPFLLMIVGCSGSSSVAPPAVPPEPEPLPSKASKPRFETPKNRNFVFTAAPLDRAPTIRPINLPPFHAAAAVWGSTGRDHRGHIYYGVSTDGDERLSAHLIEYDPATGQATDRGGAVENLKRLGLAKPGENQNKIHTKIWQAADGWLHFASMDEGGENEDGSKPPTFGSHLWRVRPEGGAWEHLAEVREAVIASAVGGKFVFYLGYFDHVLYRWDTETGQLAGRVRVGSFGGHTTRNILADSRGHVFVPRVAADNVELVEFDDMLREVAAFPLADYDTAPNSSSHGLVGIAALKDDGFAFVTDRGRLYRLTPRATGTAIVDLGTIHPDGTCYCPSLVSWDGESVVAGLGRRQGSIAWEWLTVDLRTKRATVRAATIPGEGDGVLVYGSVTRDDDGRLYLGGRAVIDGKSIAQAWALAP
ncbi:MAG: hypothetical protein KF873_17500 [Gemmataceae bacterium]|nr:hypothetical protein [Planctomycetia bacterium]MBX3400533.1 hypothetical protein [Gemmataceae bacterium]